MTLARVIGLAVICAFLWPTPTPAQHEGHEHPPPAPRPRPEPAAEKLPRARRLFQSDMTLMTGMTAGDPVGDRPVHRWQWMTMGVVRLGYNDQGGPSGEEAGESTNWMMAMVHRSLGAGRITFMMMSSLEPATIPERGSPELFQTGESFEGKPLVDRQHAHDFFMNLSATYRHPVSALGAVWLQLAPAGEPALGPTAFMHRASAGENPTAPLAHHWQDASHITHNVVTAGFGHGRLIVEASTFHGAEPDENRWDLDGGDLDSGAGRVKLDLERGWSGQLSHGYLHELERIEGGDTHRTTASIHYGAAGDRPTAAILVWGRNNESHGTSDALLAEIAHAVTLEDQVYGRIEWVEKDAGLLGTKDLAAHEVGEEEPIEVADIGALTFGYFRSLGELNGEWAPSTGVGADLTAYRFPSSLESVYGDSPVSFHMYFRWRWGQPHGAHAGHGQRRLDRDRAEPHGPHPH